MSRHDAGFFYVLTLGFGAMAGESAGGGLAYLPGLFALLSACFACVFYFEYAAWLREPESIGVPLGVRTPFLGYSITVSTPVPDAYRGDSASIPVGAR
jgi:hypothetical protein